MARISPYTFFQEMDDDGNPLAGGKLYTFEAGTSTPKVTYTSEDESAANTNPIILDASGRADVWLESGSYKFVLDDANDVNIDIADDITGGTSDVYGASIISLTANTAITTLSSNTIFDCVGTFTLSLLDVATAEEGFIFVVRNSGSGVITIDPDGSELIDGVTTKAIQPDGSLNVNCTGDEWITTNENYGTTNAKTMTFTGNNTHTGTNEFDALVIFSKGADVASATALPVLTDGNYFDVTGTNAVETINTLGIGTVIKLQFDAILTLTHDATNLILPSGANITTAAGDEAEFVEYASGDWRCTNYSRASGKPLVSTFLGFGYTSTGASITTSANISVDNTIPQNTEGAEAITLAYTPKSATSKIYIEFGSLMSANGNVDVVLALFKDTQADALASAAGRIDTSNILETVTSMHEFTSTGTASITFKLRFGSASGTAGINGTSSAQRFGGTATTYIKITEME